MNTDSKTIQAKLAQLQRDHNRLRSGSCSDFTQECKVQDRMERTVSFIQSKVGLFRTVIDSDGNITIQTIN